MGLAGRRFGTVITSFLLGGDIYTAYTFIAVPALMFGAGAIGFFAVPYTIIIYPLIFLFLPRLWSVSHRHGYVTPADFVRGRFGSKGLALAVAVTGLLATMPYIALQLVGIEAVLKAIGLTGDSFMARHLPLIIAFAILAAYTYQSGLGWDFLNLVESLNSHIGFQDEGSAATTTKAGEAGQLSKLETGRRLVLFGQRVVTVAIPFHFENVALE